MFLNRCFDMKISFYTLVRVLYILVNIGLIVLFGPKWFTLVSAMTIGYVLCTFVTDSRIDYFDVDFEEDKLEKLYELIEETMSNNIRQENYYDKHIDTTFKIYIANRNKLYDLIESFIPISNKDNKKETVLFSAIYRNDNKVYFATRPARHHHLLHFYFLYTGDVLDSENSIQGFVTSYGRFVNRTDALAIVMQSGQPTTGDPVRNGELSSENLW